MNASFVSGYPFWLSVAWLSAIFIAYLVLLAKNEEFRGLVFCITAVILAASVILATTTSIFVIFLTIFKYMNPDS